MGQPKLVGNVGENGVCLNGGLGWQPPAKKAQGRGQGKAGGMAQGLGVCSNPNCLGKSQKWAINTTMPRPQNTVPNQEAVCSVCLWGNGGNGKWAGCSLAGLGLLRLSPPSLAHMGMLTIMGITRNANGGQEEIGNTEKGRGRRGKKDGGKGNGQMHVLLFKFNVNNNK